MPLGFSLGRPCKPLSVATSARNSAMACFSAAFSASRRSLSASRSPRDSVARLVFLGVDMPITDRLHARPTQPYQPTTARTFCPSYGFIC